MFESHTGQADRGRFWNDLAGLRAVPCDFSSVQPPDPGERSEEQIEFFDASWDFYSST